MNKRDHKSAERNEYGASEQVDRCVKAGNAYRAFNLAKKGNPALTDQEQQELRSCLSIFVPKEN